MSSRTFLAGCVIAVAAVAGCYTGIDTAQPNRTTAAGVPTTSVDGTEPSASAFTGVPCNVAEVLAKDCASCHSATPTGGAPNAMMTYDDLQAPSQNDPSMSIAAMSVERMKDSKNPMPPDGASADDLAVLDAWFAAGMPQSSAACDATPAASMYDTPSVCSSKTSWTNATRASDKLMDPGEACNQCHDKGRGPSLFAAGTVYKTAHEPDDCYGVASGVNVVITGADNKSFTSAVNGSGNFYFPTSVKTPYKAKVVSADGKRSRSMSGLQTNGDCNLCHTEKGDHLTGDKQKTAPGRIMAP
jgi:hypothetical protein